MQEKKSRNEFVAARRTVLSGGVKYGLAQCGNARSTYMKIDFSDSESIGRAMKEKGEAYVALELARDVGRDVTKLANTIAEQTAAQTRFMHAFFGLLTALAAAVAVLFFTR